MLFLDEDRGVPRDPPGTPLGPPSPLPRLPCFGIPRKRLIQASSEVALMRGLGGVGEGVQQRGVQWRAVLGWTVVRVG